MEFVVIAPVIAPPVRGSAAPAVVVVEVSTESRAAISTPSTVPETATLPVTSTPEEVISSFVEPPVCSFSDPVPLSFIKLSEAS